MKRFFRRMFYYPVLAVCSRRFYVSVISRFRGVSAKYFFEVILLASLVITVYMTSVTVNYVNTDLNKLLAGFPGFVINKDGEFEFLEQQSPAVIFRESQDNRKYVSIRTPGGAPVLLFNPEHAMVDSEDLPREISSMKAPELVFHITFEKNQVSVFNGISSSAITYRELGMLPGTEVNAATVSANLRVLSSTLMPVLIFITMFISIVFKMVFSIAITSVFGYGIFYFMGVRTTMITVIRVNVYANTIILLLFSVSMFMIDSPEVFVALNGAYMGMLPMIYNFFAAVDFRKNSLGSSSSSSDSRDSSSGEGSDDSGNRSGGGFFRP
ncbi:DUF1189 family protein [Succinimonas amylolytica]|uniref:DUF1189 family protein n=1 Tax=Succinimonas amylolytica TaxID=83769 RepID=UPI000A0264D1|nr:DUF1189 family protein [Succinimonas amylolytica]